MNYYNDNDPKKTAWLRQLIKDGLIPAGDVDERPIQEVHVSDLIGYTQHHFFAGIGGWSLALQLAGVSSSHERCTCSCPCQPFSQTGKRLGFEDARHLWPSFFSLAERSRFPTIFGEQVSSPDGLLWLDGVFADLEAANYTVGAHDLCAAGVSAPHPRQRIFWVAYANEARQIRERTTSEFLSGANGASIGLADSDSQRCDRIDARLREENDRRQREEKILEAAGCGEALRLAHSDDSGSQGRRLHRDRSGKISPWAGGMELHGRDGKVRRLEPSIEPLVDGFPERVALIEGAGDAIVPLLAAEFIKACEEARELHGSNI